MCELLLLGPAGGECVVLLIYHLLFCEFEVVCFLEVILQISHRNTLIVQFSTLLSELLELLGVFWS